MKNSSSFAGQAIYSKAVLSIYDFWVLGVSNRYFWRCPTELISRHFTAHVSPNHLDVGVGSGYYLKHDLPKNTQRIALMDLNENSLEKASNSVSVVSPEVYCADVLAPLNLDIGQFDSISINYLLHCLPGDLHSKSVALENLKSLLNEGGQLFGSTILGRGTKQNACAKRLMSIYNKKGIFSNQADDVDGLKKVLESHFSNVKIELVGCVALFSGQKA